MRIRDAQDAARAAAPLRPAPDAIMIDTTASGAEEVFEQRPHPHPTASARRSKQVNTVRTLAEGFGFAEGPVVMPDGAVMLTDIGPAASGGSHRTAARPSSPAPEAVRTASRWGPTAHCTAATMAAATTGRDLFLAIGPAPDYAGGSIQRIDSRTGDVRTLYTECNGHRLSAPNDLVFDRAGGFWFTDMGKRHDRHRDHGGLYYALPDGSKIIEAAYPILSANGVGLSPDERTVYVADTEPARLWAFQIESPGKLRLDPSRPRTAAASSPASEGISDSTAWRCRQDGAICVATLVTGCITVIAPDGHVRSPGTDARQPSDQYLFRRPVPPDGLHHSVRNRTPRRDGLARSGPRPQFRWLATSSRAKPAARRRVIASEAKQSRAAARRHVIASAASNPGPAARRHVIASEAKQSRARRPPPRHCERSEAIQGPPPARHVIASDSEAIQGPAARRHVIASAAQSRARARRHVIASEAKQSRARRTPSPTPYLTTRTKRRKRVNPLEHNDLKPFHPARSARNRRAVGSQAGEAATPPPRSGACLRTR